MNNDSLISVIVPVYNVEMFVDQCIDSIVKQTYTNLEILLIDDGSLDESGKICDKWADLDDRIKVYHKKNGGLSDARNYGMDKATGSYYMFVDSDDWVENTIVEELYSQICQTNLQMVCCNFKKFKNDGFLDEHIKLEEQICDLEEYIKRIYSFEGRTKNQFEILVPAWAKLYKSSLFDDIKYPFGRINEDNYVIHHLVKKAGKVKIIDRQLYCYRLRDDSISHVKISKKKFDNFYGQMDRIEFLQDNKIDEKLKESIEYNTIHSGRTLWTQLICQKICKKDELKKEYADVREAYYKYIANRNLKFSVRILWNLFAKCPGLYLLISKIKK